MTPVFKSIIVLLLVMCGFCTASAQPKISGKVSGGFQAPTSTDNQGRRHVLKGSSGEPRGNNLWELTEPRVTSFNAEDSPELFIESPRCLFQMKENVAYSDATLSVRRADGSFSIQGVGWRWEGEGPRLTISNQVVALIQKSLLATNTTGGSPGTNAPVRITANSFVQQGENASFIGSVLVQDGPDTLRCERLDLGFVKPDGLRTIEAINNVELNQSGTIVTSGRALYDLKEETIRITEDPKWESEGRNGSAELLVLNRAAATLLAEGKVYMRFPLTNVSAAVIESDGPSAGTNRFLEVYSDKFQFVEANEQRPSSARYDGNVRVNYTDANISSAVLLVHFDATNRIRQITAETNVVIDSKGNHAYGQRAEYELKEGKIVLSGDPLWEMEGTRGSSEIVIFHPQSKEVHALHNVEMIFQGQSAGGMIGIERKEEPKAAEVPTIVRSENFSRGTNVAVFHGNVVVADARGRLSCQMVTVVTGASNQVQRIIAERNVLIEQQGFTATGAHADYNVATGLVHLTGNPELMSEGRTLRAEAFIIDRNKNTFTVSPGKYRIQVPVESKKNPLRSIP